jgi:hypothetical protein
VLVGMWIRWEGEVSRRSGALVYAVPTERTSSGSWCARGGRVAKRPPFGPRVPKMRALLEELAESEDPIAAPKDPGFFRRVRLRALGNL